MISSAPEAPQKRSGSYLEGCEDGFTTMVKPFVVARRPLESGDFASLCSEHSWEVESFGCLAWVAGVCKGFALACKVDLGHRHPLAAEGIWVFCLPSKLHCSKINAEKIGKN